LKGQSLQIGLNDKLAFIKHLFEGKNEDYDRVISQVNTTYSLAEVRKLILEMVKPDYNNWEGKDDYEERFIEIIESKFK
jgi:non-homologous end joining protein Ku